MSQENKSPKGVEAYAVNRIGHAAGRKLAAGLWKQEWIRRLASENPELTKLISEGAIALTSMLEVGGNSTIARLANFIAESFSMENLELLDKYEKNPDDPEVAKAVEEKVADFAKKSDGSVSVVVALEHVHKDDQCAMVAQYVKDATPPSFGGKPGQPPRVNPTAARLYPMTLAAALAAHKPLCGLCYPSLSTVKAEEKAKSREVVIGRNFMEYVMQLRKEEPDRYQGFWSRYLRRMDGPDGPDLARKFQDAFNGKHSYEAFRFVVSLPDRNPTTEWEEWHVALDSLLGKVTPPATLKKQIEGFIGEEKRQTEEMFRAMFAWLKKSAEARNARNESLEAELASLRERRKERADAKKTGKTAKRIVVASLLVILASWYVIQRAESADTGSAAAEQKEIPNER